MSCLNPHDCTSDDGTYDASNYSPLLDVRFSDRLPLHLAKVVFPALSQNAGTLKVELDDYDLQSQSTLCGFQSPSEPD